MTALTANQQTAVKIDIEKRKIEAIFLPKIKKIFKNMSVDASNLYRATGKLPYKQLSNNYKADFIKEIRDIFRLTIKKFGFQIRKDVEKKYGLFFDAEYKSQLLDLQLKQSQKIVDNAIDEQLEDINNQFLQSTTFFVANKSEDQTEIITETNSEMLEAAVIGATLLYNKKLQKLKENGEDDSKFIKNKNSIIAKDIKQNLDNKVDSRAIVITENNTGLAESWSRQEEASIVGDALVTAGVLVEKTWEAILDNRTRQAHAIADGQTVNVYESFFVGGEELMAPRMGSLPQNNINCRCIAVYSI